MGLIRSIREFFVDRKKRRLEKARKLVANRKAIKEDRWSAIAFLSSLEDASQAVPALLQRFEYSLEHGINDTKEKEKALEGIVSFGDEALKFVTEYLNKTTRIAWPIKALYRISDEEQIVTTLKGCLNFEDVSFDQSAVDKNYDILCYLRDYKIPDYVDKVAHFLDDADERVRFAAVEFLIEQESDQVPSLIEKYLSDDSSENRRVRQIVVDAFVGKGWKVADPSPFPEGWVMEGVSITKEGGLKQI